MIMRSLNTQWSLTRRNGRNRKKPFIYDTLIVGVMHYNHEKLKHTTNRFPVHIRIPDDDDEDPEQVTIRRVIWPWFCSFGDFVSSFL